MALFLGKLHRRGLPRQSYLLTLRPQCLHSSFHVQDECMHQLPSWKWKNPHSGHGEFGSGSCYTFPRWIGQICGQLGSSSLDFSVVPQQWNTWLFARSMSIKSREDRKKKDLARREFQLLRRRTKLLKATMSPEERLLWRLRKSNRKKAVLLQRLKKYELEEDPESVHDPELITPEQLQALKKIGYKNRNYVPVGRRGVYGGVVQNMHMHWKFHETVQVDCHIFKRESIRDIARQLAVLSGGIVIDIHQATTIIMYRGRNYKQPKTEMIPPNTLTKRKALFKSKYLQALEGLEVVIKEIQAQLQMLRRNQKEKAAQGTENGTSKPQLVAKEMVADSNLLTNLDKSSSDDDASLFSSWEFDSLDEDELSDDDDSKHKKVEGGELDRKEIAKPLSWTTEDSAQHGGKKKRLTARELILAEQELFKNSPKRLAEAAQKSGLVSSKTGKSNNSSVDRGDRLITDDDMDDENSKGVDGKFKQCESLQTDDKKPYQQTTEEDASSTDFDLEVFSDEDLTSRNDNQVVETFEGTHKLKGHKQIMNKKIAKFVEDFTTDEDEEDELFGTDFESGDDADVGESKAGQPAADAKDPRRG